MNKHRLTDVEVIRLYEEWSEENYAAGFMSSTPTLVQHFRDWLAARPADTGRSLRLYEAEVLAEYRRQEPSS